jgi:hypothetical protein
LDESTRQAIEDFISIPIYDPRFLGTTLSGIESSLVNLQNGLGYTPSILWTGYKSNEDGNSFKSITVTVSHPLTNSSYVERDITVEELDAIQERSMGEDGKIKNLMILDPWFAGIISDMLVELCHKFLFLHARSHIEYILPSTNNYIYRDREIVGVFSGMLFSAIPNNNMSCEFIIKIPKVSLKDDIELSSSNLSKLKFMYIDEKNNLAIGIIGSNSQITIKEGVAIFNIRAASDSIKIRALNSSISSSLPIDNSEAFLYKELFLPVSDFDYSLLSMNKFKKVPDPVANSDSLKIDIKRRKLLSGKHK